MSGKELIPEQTGLAGGETITEYYEFLQAVARLQQTRDGLAEAEARVNQAQKVAEQAMPRSWQPKKVKSSNALHNEGTRPGPAVRGERYLQDALNRRKEAFVTST